MKVTIDIDCTPQEARAFLGLPDVEPLQRAMMKELESKMASFMSGMDPEAVFRAWMPQAWDQMQKLWTQFAAGGAKERG